MASLLVTGCEPAEDRTADNRPSEPSASPSPADNTSGPEASATNDEAGNDADDAAGPSDPSPTDSKPADPPDAQPTTDGQPLDLEARLAELRVLQAEGEFAKALRRARLLRGRLKTIEQRQRLKPLLDELRRMNRRAKRLKLAIDRLSGGAEMERVSAAVLRQGGRTARIVLRQAVKEKPEDTARPAAELLIQLDKPAAVEAILARARIADSAERTASWIRMLPPTVSVMEQPTLQTLYHRFKQREGVERRACVEVLDAYAEQVHSADESAFNDAIGIAGAFEHLRQFVQRALESGDTDLIRWAGGSLSAFIVIPRDGLVLWLARGERGVRNVENGRLRRWSDATGNGYPAVQPDAGKRPDWAADSSPAAARFDGNDDELAIRKLTFGDQRKAEAVTVMAWFRTEDRDASILDFDRSESWCLGINFSGNKPGHISWNTTDAGNSTHDMFSEQPIDDGRWHLAIVTFDAKAGEKRIYLDGELDSKTNAHRGKPLGTGRQRFGFVGDGSEAGSFNSNTNGTQFAGDIAEAAIWNRALSAETVHNLAASRLAESHEAPNAP